MQTQAYSFVTDHPAVQAVDHLAVQAAATVTAVAEAADIVSAFAFVSAHILHLVHPVEHLADQATDHTILAQAVDQVAVQAESAAFAFAEFVDHLVQVVAQVEHHTEAMAAIDVESDCVMTPHAFE